MLGNFLKIDFDCRLLLKTLKLCLFFMRNDRLSGKQVGSQASRRVTRRLAWIQPVRIMPAPALKGLRFAAIFAIIEMKVLCGDQLLESSQRDDNNERSQHRT